MSTKSDHLPQTNGLTQGTTREQWSNEQAESGITKYNKDPLPYDYESDTDSEVENGEFTDTESEEEPSSDEESTIMADDDGSPIAPAPPRRPAKDQSGISRIHRLSSALNKRHPLLRITQVTGTHADTHDMSTGKTARWTLPRQGSLSSRPVNASTIALGRNQDCQPVARSWFLPRSNSSRPLFTSSTEDLPRANSLPTPTKLLFSDPGALNIIPEEAQASFTGKEEECPNPNDERANSLQTPAKLRFDESGA